MSNRALKKLASRAPLPPACWCGMPGSLEDTRAHRRWHRQWERRQGIADPNAEQLARAWVKAQEQG